MDAKEREHLIAIRAECSKRLRVLEIQEAKYGKDCPPHVVVEIDALKTKIASLDQKIDSSDFEITVGSKPIAYKYMPGVDLSSREAQHNILFVSNIIDSQMKELETRLGNPFDVNIANIGSLDDIPTGGEVRWYNFDDYILSIGYNKQYVAKSVRIENLSQHGYNLHEWFNVLFRLGISIAAQPDIIGIMSFTWLNYHGYHITVSLDRVGGVINIVRVFRVPE